MDGNDFNKTFERAKSLFQVVSLPDSEVGKIGLNDFYRLENKMGFALFLQAKGLNYQKFMESSSSDQDNQLFKNINKRCFYLFGNKKSIN